MKAIGQWLAGKKTFGAAALLLLVAIAGWWTGALDDIGFGVLVALAFTIVGFRDAQGRNAKLLLDELRAVKAAAADGKISKDEAKAIAAPAVSAGIEAALEHSVLGSQPAKPDYLQRPANVTVPPPPPGEVKG